MTSIAGHTKAAPVAWTRAVRLALFGSLVIVGGAGLAGSLVNVSGILGGDLSGVSGDLHAYLGYTREWLATGHWYQPAQLAGPYVVEHITGNVYPPVLLYLTVPFALGVPEPLWYLVPFGITVAAFRRLGVTPRGWFALGLFLVCYPRWWQIAVMGNPALWVIAFAVAGMAWGWPAVLAPLKLTFAPLMLVGIRHRSWWLALPVVLALCVPFGSLWLDYLTVLHNTESMRGLSYVLGEWPVALAFIAVGMWPSRGSGHEAIRGRLRSAADHATLAAGRG